MWYRHWGMERDPFQDLAAPYVPLPGHEEAVARLVHVIDASEPLAFLTGAAGAGKTRVILQALEEARRPSRRFAWAAGFMSEQSAVLGLARKLGGRPTDDLSEGHAWQTLRQAIRVCRIQGAAVILIVEGCDLPEGSQGALWQRLANLAADLGQVTVVAVGDEECEAGEDLGDRRAWSLTINLPRLTASEAARYLEQRLAAAGCRDSVFTPRALSRLHLLSGGTPRGLNRLGSLGLIAAAARRLEAVPSELIDDVSRECRLPLAFALPS
ncbi:AAA family ATPase [Aquisphaera insulae]|uniref:AAA family ATPase n=1 Tax=Aquisphaera insulae TaxID=2712864 RepID=UPI0013EA74B6|nr:AAA family ATPase [Aquisphaera insulae]